MSNPFDLAEAAFQAGLMPVKPTATSPEEMTTSALLAEMCSYFVEHEERFKAVNLGWGGKEIRDVYLARRNAVCAEIDRRIPLMSSSTRL